jgi:competence protein ComEA
MTPAAPIPKSKAVPRLLATVAVVLLAMLAWRAYSPHFTARPTELVTVASPVDVNAADRGELLQIPGVGPATADAILAQRQRLGRFESLEELHTVHGIGSKTIEKLRPWLMIGPGSPRILEIEPVERLERKPATPATGKAAAVTEPINVNTANAEELHKLPGIGPKLAERIIAERAKAPFKSPEDLHRVSGIGPKTIEKLRPLVKFEN